MRTIRERSIFDTRKAPWHVDPQAGHWYVASTEFAKSHLTGAGKCLVIGSPLFEATELTEMGWDVTYLDVRTPPIQIKFVLGDATKMDFADSSFDAVSSSCVMTHAGLGRYGDALVERGDLQMLREIKRVLKPNAKAAITIGPVAFIKEPLLIGNLHRVYTIGEAERMAQEVGLVIEDLKVWGTAEHKWVEAPTANHNEPDYLSVLLRHVAPPE